MMKSNYINSTDVSVAKIKQVLAFIEKQKQEFAQLPFFRFLLNKNIDPAQRLKFAPCAAPLVMGFAELNKYIFREEPTCDPIQILINQHTYEDDHHWIWFLSDLQKLGMDKLLRFSDALKFLWGEETQISRWVIYELYCYTCQATPIQKLIVIEAIEATGNVFLSAVTQVGQELQTITGEKYQYFASSHLAIDSEHTLYSVESEQLIESIQLTETELENAFEIAKKTFAIFTALTNAFLAYVQKHKPLSFK